MAQETIASMSHEELKLFLEAEAGRDAAQILRSHQITGAMFLRLNEKHLRRFGISESGVTALMRLRHPLSQRGLSRFLLDLHTSIHRQIHPDVSFTPVQHVLFQSSAPLDEATQLRV